MSSASNSTTVKKNNCIGSTNNSNIDKNKSSGVNKCEDFKLLHSEKIEVENYRKRKADRKNKQTMENDEKRIKLENIIIREDENAREKMFQVSDAVKFIDCLFSDKFRQL